MKVRMASSRRRLFTVLLATTLAGSQSLKAGEVRPEAFGTAATTMVQVPAAQCYAFGGIDASLATNEFIRTVSGPGTFECFPNLPTGSKLVRIEVVAYDGSDTGAVNLNLVRCQSLDVNDLCTQTGLVATAGSAVSPFSGRLAADLSADPIVVDKTSELDFVRVSLTSGTVDLEFREVDFFYQLQVSTPAPGTQTFADVPPGFLYYKGIEALAASGITGGCGNGNFCPNGYVTRGEIATFFARALGLHFPN
jgi:S-layer family protein